MSVPLDTRVVAQTDTYVEVARKYPLWAAVPDHQRASPELIRAKNPRAMDEQWPWVVRVLEQLAHPEAGCPVATRMPDLGSRIYTPCSYSVAPGATFCHSHGGASAAMKPVRQFESKAEIAAERDALKAELAALREACEPLKPLPRTLPERTSTTS